MRPNRLIDSPAAAGLRSLLPLLGAILIWLPTTLLATVAPADGLERRTLLTDRSAKASASARPGDERASEADVAAAGARALRGSAQDLGTDLLASLQPDSVHRSAHGPYIALYRQWVEGIEVIGSRVAVVLDRDLQPRAITGSWARDGARAKAGGDWRIAPELAVQLALGQPGPVSGSVRALAQRTEHGGWQHYEKAAGGGADSLRLRRGWLAQDGGLHAVFRVEVIEGGGEHPHAEDVLVSARDGRVLQRSSLLHDAVRYRVFADADGHPYVDPYGYSNPHPTGQADGSKPATLAPMHLVEREHGGIHSGDPWLPAGATSTVGNNVDAFFNSMTLINGLYNWWWLADDDFRFFNAAHGDLRAQANVPGGFDYPYNADGAPFDYFQLAGTPPTAPQAAQLVAVNAKIVQGFYAGNWLHDLFYNLGFDEQSGNAQHDNFGRGGLANDRLLIHAGASSTFAMVPDDGVSPLLVLGLNANSLSRRDASGIAFDIVAHEWAHTMFGRLVPIPRTAQMGAINEGTADFIGFFLGVRAQDGPDYLGAYAFGAYYNVDYFEPFSGQPPVGSPGVPENTWYHGVRRFPYSADAARNPLSFRHISMDHPVPAQWNAFDWKWRALTNAEIHTAGEIWASALWQCARNILAERPAATFMSDRDRFLGYLVASLKLLPAGPTYIEARDALLLAIRSDDENAWRQCRAGFAARGMGAGALAPPRESIDFRGLVESTSDADHALTISAVRLLPVDGEDTVLDYGERGMLVVEVRNSGFDAIVDLRVRASSTDGYSRLAQPLLGEGLTLAPGQQRELAVEVDLLSAQGLRELGFAVLADSAAGAIEERVQASFRSNYELAQVAHVDDADNDERFALDWQIATGGYPHGCTLVCLGDVLNWRLAQHEGESAYVVGDQHLAFNTHLIGPPIRAASDRALVIELRHAWKLDRPNPLGAQRAAAAVDLSIDGGPWVPAANHLPAATPGRFVGSSTGWREDRLNFGNSFAGREVRLRLRVLSDASYEARAAFWAVSRVSVEGAAEPVFHSVLAPQLDVLAVHSGSYFPPDRSGEGWVVEVLDDTLAVVTWFTFAPTGSGGEQQWIQGLGRIEGNRVRIDNALMTRGPRFGPDFDPDLVEHIPWGSLQLEFNGCDDLVVHYQGAPAFGSGVHRAQRLTGLVALPCNAPGGPTDLRSGAWFDPTHDGEGWFIQEIAGDRAAVFWFTYTPQGEQAWLTGVGQFDGPRLVVDNLLSAHGTHFGDDFDPAAVELRSWGSMQMDFIDCLHANVSYQSVHSGYGSGTLAPVRLTWPLGLGCERP